MEQRNLGQVEGMKENEKRRGKILGGLGYSVFSEMALEEWYKEQWDRSVQDTEDGGYAPKLGVLEQLSRSQA
jgi:hypothetical protein